MALQTYITVKILLFLNTQDIKLAEDVSIFTYEMIAVFLLSVIMINEYFNQIMVLAYLADLIFNKGTANKLIYGNLFLNVVF